MIPIQRFDPVALAAMSYFPLPNRAGTATNANNFIGSSRNALNRDIVVGRLDHQFRPFGSGDGALLHQRRQHQ